MAIGGGRLNGRILTEKRNHVGEGASFCNGRHVGDVASWSFQDDQARRQARDGAY